MDMPSLPDEEINLARNDEITALKKQVAALTGEIAALKALQPPPEKPLMLSDLKVVGHQRLAFDKPDESWLPTFQECANLALIVEKSYPYLVTRSDDWVIQFRRALLALGNCNRAPEPNNQEWGRWIGEWLEDHLIWGGVERGPFLTAIAASGDIPFSGFGERDAFAGTLPKAGLAPRHRGSLPDKMAWKKVLAEKRLIAECGTVSPPPGQSRWDNPRSSVTLLPELDARKSVATATGVDDQQGSGFVPLFLFIIRVKIVAAFIDRLFGAFIVALIFDLLFASFLFALIRRVGPVVTCRVVRFVGICVVRIFWTLVLHQPLERRLAPPTPPCIANGQGNGLAVAEIRGLWISLGGLPGLLFKKHPAAVANVLSALRAGGLTVLLGLARSAVRFPSPIDQVGQMTKSAAHRHSPSAAWPRSGDSRAARENVLIQRGKIAARSPRPSFGSPEISR
jgi:hypothetical protein